MDYMKVTTLATWAPRNPIGSFEMHEFMLFGYPFQLTRNLTSPHLHLILPRTSLISYRSPFFDCNGVGGAERTVVRFFPARVSTRFIIFIAWSRLVFTWHVIPQRTVGSELKGFVRLLEIIQALENKLVL